MRPPPRISSPSRQHHALPRRHRALRAAELHADPLPVERLDHGGHVVASIPDADGCLERPVVRGVAGDPRDAVGDESSPRQQLLRSDHHAVRRGIHVDDVPALARRDAQSTTLPHRERERPVVRADRPPVGVHDRALVHELRRRRTDERAGVSRRGEAQLLGIRLGRHRQPEPLGVRARLGLRHPADREQRARQLALPQHVQHVALVLRRRPRRAAGATRHGRLARVRT